MACEKSLFLKSKYLYAMQTLTRQEVIAEYLILAEGILVIYRGKDINHIYSQLHYNLHKALIPYTCANVDAVELKWINLGIVQEIVDASPTH